MGAIKAPGFESAGVACGIKKSNSKDLALIVSDRPATAAALFTTNRVKAAPIIVGMRHLRGGKRGVCDGSVKAERKDAS